MSDSETNPLDSLLSSFALGPAWARAVGGKTDASKFESRSPKSSASPKGFSSERNFSDRESSGKPFRRPGKQQNDRRFAPPPPPERPQPAAGVRVTLLPEANAVHLIGKEIHQVARVYPIYEVAQILLSERARCRAIFETSDPNSTLFLGKLDESLFLTREEAVRHLWNSSLKDQLIEEETIDVEPPSGNFQLVAKCGLSGEWLGPPNFHAYQINLRRIHRERFPNLPFTAYCAKVRTERGEEAVNAWLESTKRKTRWRLKDDTSGEWLEDCAEAQRSLATHCFSKAFEETRRAELAASVPPENLSPSLAISLKFAGNHARNHPAILIPSVCKALENEHLPVFKRQGKLYTGPARPHPLPPGQALAERPGIMVEWIRANKPAKLEGLWQAVLPEGSNAPPAEFAADLFWLLHQGHILLFTDDTLVVQELRETSEPLPASPESKSSKKKKKKKKPAGETPTDSAAPESSENSENAEPESSEADSSEEISGEMEASEIEESTSTETAEVPEPIASEVSPTEESSEKPTAPAAAPAPKDEPAAVEISDSSDEKLTSKVDEPVSP